MFTTHISRITSNLLIAIVMLVELALNVTPANAVARTDLSGPSGSGKFGETVIVLPNGNIVITDPGYDTGATVDAGASYLYNGATLELVSTLTGSTTNDRVSSSGVQVLANGNYVVRSKFWINGGVANAGAVTWCSAEIGCSGVVSAGNSLVGLQAGDQVGSDGVVVLPNGNYVVQSPNWANGSAVKAGAVTWCSGTTGCASAVNPTNSLVGSTANDQIGFYPDRVVALANGDYVVPSPFWSNGSATRAGAVTTCSGTSGCTGPVTVVNSLVGTQTGDEVGGYEVIPLSNSSYVVQSPAWANGGVVNAGAVTWCIGATGCIGPVTLANSLVGSSAADRVGGFGVTKLTNNHFVVNSQWWDNGGIADAGAVTWCSGTTACTGAVAATNSLVGSHANDQVGYGGVTALTNGNYVVVSINWKNDTIAKAGAATFCSGTAGCKGAVTVSNSLVGSKANDQVGFNSVAALTNGNYVVNSPYWDNGGIADAGAVTFCSGTVGCSGAVTAGSSLVGSSAGDMVGGVLKLTNGNYVVNSPSWANSGAAKAGASTWCSGTAGCSGPVTSANSLVGIGANDQVGYAARALLNGNYVVLSPQWANSGAAKAGATTWCSGTAGCKGAVTVSNSLVGSQANDQIGYSGVVAFTNGNYIVNSQYWDNGGIADAGAVTFCSGTAGCSGAVTPGGSLVGGTASDMVGNWGAGTMVFANRLYVVQSPTWNNSGMVDSGAVTWVSAISGGPTGLITSQNSVLGTAASGGYAMNAAYNDRFDYLIVSRPADNMVTVLFVFVKTYVPLIRR